MFPVTSALPPEDDAYQSIVSPAAGVDVSATVPVPQRELLPADGAATV